MFKKNQVIGISDLTSSEGKLERFTTLCRLLFSERGLTKDRIVALAKKVGPPFHNKKVTERHLVIMEKIGIIEKMDDIYVLSSEGKALCKLAIQTRETNRLIFEEKVFYFKMLFTSIVKDQLLKLLEIVMKYEECETKKIIGAFFSTNFAKNLWNRKVIERNLMKLEKGNIPSFFRNKFGCMEMWLRDLGLIRRLNGKIMLNHGAKTLLATIQHMRDLRDKIYELAAVALETKVVGIDYSRHRNEFLKVFDEACQLFKTQENMSDIRAIRTFTCIKFLARGLKIEENEFDQIIKELWKEGKIESIMTGRDGRPAYVVLSRFT